MIDPNPFDDDELATFRAVVVIALAALVASLIFLGLYFFG